MNARLFLATPMPVLDEAHVQAQFDELSDEELEQLSEKIHALADMQLRCVELIETTLQRRKAVRLDG